MSNYGELISTINELYNRKGIIEQMEAPIGFPFPTIYSGQAKALESLSQLKSALLCSHTGSGKTAVFTAATRGESTIIIEPRKFLQTQVAELYSDFVLFGRSEYTCKYGRNAGLAACLTKKECSDEIYPNRRNLCESFKDKCDTDPCDIFYHNDMVKRYPCDSCLYLDAQFHAFNVLARKGTVVCNFGNFWNLVKLADTIVIDEADLFFKEISAPQQLNHSDTLGDISKMLSIEIRELESLRQEEQSKEKSYKYLNTIRRMQFFNKNSSECFSYIKKNRKTNTDKVYVEINPMSTNVLLEKLFESKNEKDKKKRIIVVTATPTSFNLPSISYSVWQRCGIYYVPQGKLTSRELHLKPYLIEHAATFIEGMTNIFEGIYGSKKFVVHCGNIGNHATKINELLEPKKCVLHEAGNLMGTINTFMDSDKRYLLVASAEYGADFSWCQCQFVLKFPYASYDERMRALERTVGKEKFKDLYTSDGIARLIQQCGRVGRGAGSFGCTFVLDQKFSEVYKQYSHKFPDWFKSRLHSGTF